MSKMSILALAAVPLVSCQTIADQGPTVAKNPGYRAIGTEPFWSLTIDGKNMIFRAAGEDEIFSSGTVSRPSLNGWRHVSKTITADVTFTPCSDGMSDRTYKDTVTVMIRDDIYKGCGGGISPPVTLERTAWRVAFIDGAEIPAAQGALVSFGDGRMSGSIGCNRLGADYSYSAGKLGFGPVMSTRMACSDPLAAQEFAFVTVLETLKSSNFNTDGSFLFTGADGGSMVLEQSI